MYPGYDQLVNEASRIRYRSAGDFTVPLTVRMPYGGGIRGGQTHSQSPEALFTHVAGLKTVIPSTPYDAKGLLISAIEDDDPVIFMEPKRIYNGPFDGFHDRQVSPWSKHPASEVPEGYYNNPDRQGEHRPRRRSAHRARLRHHGPRRARRRRTKPASTPKSSICARSCRSTSRRSSAPSKKPAAASSSTKPHAPPASAANSRALVQEHCFYKLEAPIERVTGYDTPYPHSQEWEYFPTPPRIIKAMRRVMEA